MGLSSNVLWHQTRKDGLMNILKTRKLYYSYSLESILANDEFQSIAFPMVSLCDLPLSEFGENKWTYGNYAIGLSRSWAMEQGFNPVCYCHQGSKYLQTMMDNLNYAVKTLDDNLFLKALYPFSYMKLVEGSLPKKNFKNYRFYDEKEVRLVPRLGSADLDGYPFFLIDRQYAKYKDSKGDSLLGTNGIAFSYADVKYIIVDKDSNRSEIQALFDKIEVEYSHIVILTKEEVLGDIVGSNHNVVLNNEVGVVKSPNIKDLALKVAEEYIKNKKRK